MDARDTDTDLGLGLGLGLGIVAVGGALVLFVEAGSPAAAWGFAVAVVAAGLAVAATQLS